MRGVRQFAQDWLLVVSWTRLGISLLSTRCRDGYRLTILLLIHLSQGTFFSRSKASTTQLAPLLADVSLPLTSLGSRGVLCKTPLSPGTISGLTGFPGDSSDSGRNPGLEREADLGILRGRPRTNRGKSRTPLPFSRSGLKMSDFFLRDCEESAARGNRFLVKTRL